VLACDGGRGTVVLMRVLMDNKVMDTTAGQTVAVGC